MAEPIAMPRLGWTMEEGTLVEWLKADGDAVEAGEILFTVESDKALNEIETFSGGILRIPLGRAPTRRYGAGGYPVGLSVAARRGNADCARLQLLPQSRFQRLRNPRP